MENIKEKENQKKENKENFIDEMNQQSELFKSQLQEMKNKCYNEMNEKYTNILKEKMKEIHNTIFKEVQQQNQLILDNYVKQFEDMEIKRENDYEQMSKIMLENPQKNEGEFFSFVKTVHHGIKCEKCGQEPITGYRYKCSVCANYNLCEQCEQKNSENLEHNHNFIKIRDEEKKPEIKPIKENKKIEMNPPKQEKIMNINELNENQKEEYDYELSSSNLNELNKEAIEGIDKEVIFKIKLLNNSEFKWPGEGKTKLIIDKNSEIKHDEIQLNNVPPKGGQIFEIKLNIDKLKEGNKKCIFNFNVEGKNYGKSLILNINIKEDERVKQLRKEYELSKDEYSNERLLEALKKEEWDLQKAFVSLFNN